MNAAVDKRWRTYWLTAYKSKLQSVSHHCLADVLKLFLGITTPAN